jgi:2-methylisocitrate lyase-like PEP mutase family enzyme
MSVIRTIALCVAAVIVARSISDTFLSGWIAGCTVMLLDHICDRVRA